MTAPWLRRTLWTLLLPMAIAMAAGFPLRAQAYDRIPVKTANPLTADKSFTTFMRELRLAAERQDRPAIHGVLARDFRVARDPRGLFDRRASAKRNFDAVLPRSEDLDALLHARSYGPTDAFPKAYCGPQPLGQRYAQRIRQMAQSTAPKTNPLTGWAYVEAGNVPVRLQDNRRARIIASLSYEAVLIRKGHEVWPLVETPAGTRGYVSARDLSFQLSPRLCYAKLRNQWRIVGYEGSGR